MDDNTLNQILHAGPLGLALIAWAELRLLPLVRAIKATTDATATKVGAAASPSTVTP